MLEFDGIFRLYDRELYRILKFELPRGESETFDSSHENKMKIVYIWEENTDKPKIQNVYIQITCFRCEEIKEYKIPRDELIINRFNSRRDCFHTFCVICPELHSYERMFKIDNIIHYINSIIIKLIISLQNH